MNNIKGKEIVLGVTGSIACYKSAILASFLVQQGANVHVIMTSSAQKFIHPSLFRGITHREVITDLFALESPLAMDHISLAKKDMIVIAPTTANTIARIAGGFSDDPLTCTVIATTAPVILAPAMETHMFQNFIVQENIQKLKENGYYILGPEKGHLASGAEGIGRMSEPEKIAAYMNTILGENGDLKQLKILVTAGGTQEAIDPVRSLTNRSTGKMGYSIAAEAKSRGASVTLISARTHLKVPFGVQNIAVTTAVDMLEAVKSEIANHDIIIMSAAVADWRAKEIATSKVKKGSKESWAIDFVRNPDILREIKDTPIFKVGFAAESDAVIENALDKLIAKNLDLIIANDITTPNSAFGSDENEVYIITKEKGEKLPLMSKKDVANKILDKVKILLRK